MKIHIRVEYDATIIIDDPLPGLDEEHVTKELFQQMKFPTIPTNDWNARLEFGDQELVNWEKE